MNDKIRRYKIDKLLRDRGLSDDDCNIGFEQSLKEEVQNKLKKDIDKLNNQLNFLVDTYKDKLLI